MNFNLKLQKSFIYTPIQINVKEQNNLITFDIFDPPYLLAIRLFPLFFLKQNRYLITNKNSKHHGDIGFPQDRKFLALFTPIFWLFSRNNNQNILDAKYMICHICHKSRANPPPPTKLTNQFH